MFPDSLQPVMLYSANRNLEDVSRYPPFKTIVSHLDVQSKKNLRLMSSTLNLSLLEIEKETFKHWTFSALHTNKLLVFMNEVPFIKGLKAVLLGDEDVYVEPFDDSVNAQYHSNLENFDEPGPYISPERVRHVCDEVIERLVNTHPDITDIDFAFRPFNDHKCPVDMGARGLNALLSLTRLKSLKLVNCSLVGTGPDANRINSVNLQELEFNQTELTGLPAIVKACGNSLKSVKLSRCPSVADFEGMDGLEFKGKLESIEDFELDEDTSKAKLTDIGFLRVLNLCGQSLKYLDISCTEMSGEIASSFSGTLPNLESLSLSYNDGLTHLGIYRCIQKLGGNLTYLALNDLRFLGEALHHEERNDDIYLPRLEELSLMQNDHLRDIEEILMWILSLCGDALKSLIVDFKHQLSPHSLNWIKEKYPGLVWIDWS